MTIATLKDLQKVITLCRRNGIVSIKIDGIELELSLNADIGKKRHNSALFAKDDIQIPVIPVFAPGGVTEETDIVAESVAIATDELTQEQLMFYSTMPEDPTLEAKHQ